MYFENILCNGKDDFLQVKVMWGAQNIFLFYYETNFINHNINFFRYIDDITSFNCDNFESISFSFYPKELVLKNTNSNNFTSFLDQKIHFATKNWVISVYDKRLGFNFKVNCLTNWSSCIINKVLKNILQWFHD